MATRTNWKEIYNDLPTHVAEALRAARLKPEQLVTKTDGELMAIEGIKEEDVNSIRAIYNTDSLESVQKAAVEAGVTTEIEEVAPGEVAKPKKVIAPHKRSAKYKRMAKLVSRDTTHDVKAAVELLAKLAKSSKLKTVELTLNVRENGLRGEIKLPHSTGKEVKIAIFSSEVETKIAAGIIDFGILLAAPSDMPKLAKFAKVLGPKGLMPNPRNGTVTDHPDKRAAELAAGGTLPYKAEAKSPIIHLALGPITQKDSDLVDNINEAIRSIGPSKIKTAFVSCTQTPSVRLNIGSI